MPPNAEDRLVRLENAEFTDAVPDCRAAPLKMSQIEEYAGGVVAVAVVLVVGVCVGTDDVLPVAVPFNRYQSARAAPPIATIQIAVLLICFL